MTNVGSQIDERPPSIRTMAPPSVALQELRPLAIGKVPVGFPVVQAALSWYSDGPMRIVARRLGAPYTVAEVKIDRFLLDLKDRSRTRHHLQVNNEEHPVGGQLMGAEPAEFG